MEPKIIKFIIWVALVCLWNFGVPDALPIHDVIAAVLLSFVTIIKFHQSHKFNLADVNQDGSMDVIDIVLLVGMILNQQITRD